MLYSSPRLTFAGLKHSTVRVGPKGAIFYPKKICNISSHGSATIKNKVSSLMERKSRNRFIIVTTVEKLLSKMTATMAAKSTKICRS